jgi:hypothetical protein
MDILVAGLLTAEQRTPNLFISTLFWVVGRRVVFRPKRILHSPFVSSVLHIYLAEIFLEQDVAHLPRVSLGIAGIYL